MKTKNNKLFDKQLLRESLRASVRKLAPRTMIKNPIMFTVEIVTAMMLTMLFYILLSGRHVAGYVRLQPRHLPCAARNTPLRKLRRGDRRSARQSAGRLAAQNPRGDSRQTGCGRFRTDHQQFRSEEKRYFRMRRRRHDPRRRRDHRRIGFDRRKRDHGRKRTGDPRSGRRQKFGDRAVRRCCRTVSAPKSPHSPARASSTK